MTMETMQPLKFSTRIKVPVLKKEKWNLTKTFHWRTSRTRKDKAVKITLFKIKEQTLTNPSATILTQNMFWLTQNPLQVCLCIESTWRTFLSFKGASQGWWIKRRWLVNQLRAWTQIIKRCTHLYKLLLLIWWWTQWCKLHRWWWTRWWCKAHHRVFLFLFNMCNLLLLI